MIKTILIIFTLLISSDCLALTQQQTQRYDNLNKEIRCVVCQGQSIADSNAPIAHDMRLKIKSLLKKQYSDEEIRYYLAARYGDFILLQPKVNRTTWLLWGFPFAAILFALFAIFRKTLPSRVSKGCKPRQG